MNKFGILGQIGMMVMSYGIGSMAMAGLKALGSGFMSGLSSAGWTTAAASGAGAGATATGAAATVGSSAIPGGFSALAPSAAGAVKTGAQLAKIAAAKTAAVTGTQVAAAGPAAGMARVAHGVLEGAAKIASLPGKVVGTITDQVVGTVTDVAKAFGNSMKMTFNPTGKLAEGAVRFDDIFSNAAARFKTGTESVANAFRDVGDMYQGVRSGDYGTDYQTFIDPSRPQTLDPATGKPITTTKNVKYSGENKALAAQAAQAEINARADWKAAIKGRNITAARVDAASDLTVQETQTQMNADRIRGFYGEGDAVIHGETRLLNPTFESEIYGTGSESLLAGVKQSTSKHFDVTQAGGAAVTGKINSAFNPPQPLDDTVFSRGPYQTGTPALVDAIEEQSDIGGLVQTATIENNPLGGNSALGFDPTNEWNSFYNNANKQFGFAINRPTSGGNFANV